MNDRTPALTAEFVAGLFGYRPNGKPNCADGTNAPSIVIAHAVMESLGVGTGTAAPSDPGASLEIGIEHWLADRLPTIAPNRRWQVARARFVTEFVQYDHLARLQALIDGDKTRTLRAEIGGDYLVRPDVTVGLEVPTGELLHASVSCKWTIRSDRVQNVRHEAVILARHRRGRQPHIVGVTAEPLPTRIASIARGTGEVDGIYHVALPALSGAVAALGSQEQRDVLAELVGQARLFDLSDLPGTIAE